jgi:hypothetical protein
MGGAPAPLTRRLAIICDLDGTLTSCAWRRHFVTPARGFHKDWASFNAGIPFDRVVPAVLQKVQEAHAQDLAVLITSGRAATPAIRTATREWLEKHSVPYDFLFMRSGKDFREDSVVKEEIYRVWIEPHFDVIRVYDDRPQVCAMWERIGLSVEWHVDPELPGPFS